MLCSAGVLGLLSLVFFFLSSFLLSHAAHIVYRGNYKWLPECHHPEEQSGRSLRMSSIYKSHSRGFCSVSGNFTEQSWKQSLSHKSIQLQLFQHDCEIIQVLHVLLFRFVIFVFSSTFVLLWKDFCKGELIDLWIPSRTFEWKCEGREKLLWLFPSLFLFWSRHVWSWLAAEDQ